MSRHPLKLNLALAGFITLAACQTPPPPVEAERPEFAAPDFRSLDAAYDAPLPADWWRGFSDPALSELVSEALRRNAGLRVQDGIVEESTALLRRAQIDRSYSTATTGSAEINRPVQGIDNDVDFTATASLAASWEWDYAGRLAALIESAGFDLEAARQSRRDLAAIVASETALAYADLRGAQYRRSVAQRNGELQAEGLELIDALLENGRATQLDYEQALTQYRTTLASLPVFDAAIENALNRLAALTGRSPSEPGDLAGLLDWSGELPLREGSLAVGDPQALLQRRPDIRLVEAQLQSDLALSEAARAAYYPSIVFNANALALLSDPGDIIDTDSFGFAIGPSISWAGPDLRGLEAQVDISDARVRQSVASYEQTVLDALAEVESALSAYSKELERREDLRAAVEAARRSLELARLRYEEGLDDYLDVLDAQRALLSTEDQLALSQVETTRRAIAAYRALGGIWDDEELNGFRTQTVETG